MTTLQSVGLAVLGALLNSMYQLAYSLIYSVTLFCSGFDEGQTKAVAEFFDGNSHFGVLIFMG